MSVLSGLPVPSILSTLSLLNRFLNSLTSLVGVLIIRRLLSCLSFHLLVLAPTPLLLPHLLLAAKKRRCQKMQTCHMTHHPRPCSPPFQTRQKSFGDSHTKSVPSNRHKNGFHASLGSFCPSRKVIWRNDSYGGARLSPLKFKFSAPKVKSQPKKERQVAKIVILTA